MVGNKNTLPTHFTQKFRSAKLLREILIDGVVGNNNTLPTLQKSL